MQKIWLTICNWVYNCIYILAPSTRDRVSVGNFGTIDGSTIEWNGMDGTAQWLRLWWSLRSCRWSIYIFFLYNDQVCGWYVFSWPHALIPSTHAARASNPCVRWKIQTLAISILRPTTRNNSSKRYRQMPNGILLYQYQDRFFLNTWNTKW